MLITVVLAFLTAYSDGAFVPATSDINNSTWDPTYLDISNVVTSTISGGLERDVAHNASSQSQHTASEWAISDSISAPHQSSDGIDLQPSIDVVLTNTSNFDDSTSPKSFYTAYKHHTRFNQSLVGPETSIFNVTTPIPSNGYTATTANKTQSTVWNIKTDELNTSFTQRNAVNETVPSTPSVVRKKIYVGGLFELTGQFAGSGRSELATAQMAITDVNKRDFIPGYSLEIVTNDTKCDPGTGMDALYDFIYRKPTILVVVGSACSSVTQTVAQLVSNWNLVQVSFGATSPALSNTRYFPDFYRLAAADSSHNTARKLFIEHFRWKTVATLAEDKESYTLAISDMSKEFEDARITIKASPTFRSSEADDLRLKMEDLRETDARIIIGSFSQSAAREVFCQAYRLRMYGPRYVWLLLDVYPTLWWTVNNATNCSVENLAEAIRYHFSVDALNELLGDRKAISGLSSGDFVAKYLEEQLPLPRSPFAPQTYDTIWTVAYALQIYLKRGRRPEEFTYSDGRQFKEDLKNIIRHMDFVGVSGPISFDGPDRKGITVLEQNQDGKMVRLALCYPDNRTLDFSCEGCRPIIWGGGRVPVDNITISSYTKTIEPTVFLIICSICGIGILQAIFFLAFNLMYRKLKYIKLSSPVLNNVAVVGCILVYAAVIVLGIDERILSASMFPTLCTIRALLFSAGFSLAFGAMFTKTYRVHHICSHTNSGLVKRKLLKDKQLLTIIGALLILDSIIIIIWTVSDPMHRHVQSFAVETSPDNPDLHLVPQLSTCYSYHIEKWTGVMYTYKGLMLVFGVYMAWSTRRVKIPALNDSKYIGLNVYNVVIMSVLVVSMSNVLSDEPTMTYIMVSSFIITSTTATLCLLFLPKIYVILRSGGNPVITSCGITVEANTRRFVIDERKEKQYRAEVQNRIFKRENAELDRDVTRAQHRLACPPSPLLLLKSASTEDRRYQNRKDVAHKLARSPLIARKKKAKQYQNSHGYIPYVSRSQDSDSSSPRSLNQRPLTSLIYTNKNSFANLKFGSTDSIDDETEFTEVEALKEELSERYWPKIREQFRPIGENLVPSVRSKSRKYRRSDGQQCELVSLLDEDQGDQSGSLQSHAHEAIEMKHFNSDPALISEAPYYPARTLSLKHKRVSRTSSNPGLPSRLVSRSQSSTFSHKPFVSKSKSSSFAQHIPPRARPKGIPKSQSAQQDKIRAEFFKIERELKSLGDIKCAVARV